MARGQLDYEAFEVALGRIDQLSTDVQARAEYIVALWRHCLVPLLEDVRSATARRVVLLKDGFVEQREVLLPATDFATAQKLADAYKHSEVDELEGSRWEQVVREHLGDDYFDILVAESQDNLQWHMTLAETTKTDVTNLGCAALQNLFESWSRSVTQALRDSDLAGFLGGSKVWDLKLEGWESLRILKALVNDIKHKASRHAESAGFFKGRAGELILVDLEYLNRMADYLRKYVGAFSPWLRRQAQERIG